MGLECSEPPGPYLPDVHVQHGAFAPDGAVLDVASGGESQEPQEAEGQSLAGHSGGTGGEFWLLIPSAGPVFIVLAPT